jgi:hypothetical protein
MSDPRSNEDLPDISRLGRWSLPPIAGRRRDPLYKVVVLAAAIAGLYLVTFFVFWLVVFDEDACWGGRADVPGYTRTLSGWPLPHWECSYADGSTFDAYLGGNGP